MKRCRLRLVTSIMLLCMGFVFSGCKKFEEDDEWIHFRTVKKRIEGLKELTMHQLGPMDLLPYWHSRFGDFYLDLTLISYHPYKKGHGYQVMVYNKTSDSLICEGQWGFMGSERIFIHFDCLDTITSLDFPDRVNEIPGTIVKLSNTEMWLKNYSQWLDSLNPNVTREVRFKEYKK
jgi:hypothetical protein